MVVASRGAHRALAGTLVLLLLGSLGLSGCTGLPDDDAKPNVVVVMTDDQWWGSLRHMPHTQRLVAAKGVSFDRFYAATPQCCPSRSTFLTGQYTHNHGVRQNSLPLGGYNKLDEQRTLPLWMQEAGYVTSHIGKYPNGYGLRNPTHVPPGWSEWHGSIDPTTYNMWGYRLNENGALRTYGHPNRENPRYYQTDVYRNKGIDFINRQASADEPFFLSLAMLAPHHERAALVATQSRTMRPQIRPAPRPAPRHEDEFARARLPKDPSFGETKMSDKPALLRGYPPLDQNSKAAITASYRGRLASLLAVDEAVRELVRTLKRTGELDNTYLIFTSDNGYFFGQHNVPTGKFLPHETSSHVPLLIRGPGIPAGQRTNELTTNADLAATIADISDAQPNLTLDGRSLLPFARHPQLRTSRPVLHEGAAGAFPTPTDDRRPEGSADSNRDQDPATQPQGRSSGPVLSAAYEAIRTKRYLYIRYADGGRELYDLRRDPYGLISRDSAPSYSETRRFLDRQLDRLQGCSGRECLLKIPPAPGPDRV